MPSLQYFPLNINTPESFPSRFYPRICFIKQGVRTVGTTYRTVSHYGVSHQLNVQATQRDSMPPLRDVRIRMRYLRFHTDLIPA